MKRKYFTNNFNNSTNSESFDYTKEGELMRHSVSKSLYMNPHVETFLNYVSILFVDLINNVKRIKRHYIYSVDKHDDNID